MARASAQMPYPQQPPPVIDITIEEQPLQQLGRYVNVLLAFFMTVPGAIVLGALIAAIFYRAYLLSKLSSFRDWLVSFVCAMFGSKSPNTTILVDSDGKPIDIRAATRQGVLEALQQSEGRDPTYPPPNPSGAGAQPRGASK